jgi:hypothetical protein
MRNYIIGNDGITLCHEAPATVSEGEIAVASKDELHTAPLSGKRLLTRTAREQRADRTGPWKLGGRVRHDIRIIRR